MKPLKRPAPGMKMPKGIEVQGANNYSACRWACEVWEREKSTNPI